MQAYRNVNTETHWGYFKKSKDYPVKTQEEDLRDIMTKKKGGPKKWKIKTQLVKHKSGSHNTPSAYFSKCKVTRDNFPADQKCCIQNHVTTSTLYSYLVVASYCM